MRRIEEHRWIEPRTTPLPHWARRRYLLVEESPDVLVAFTVIHSANGVVTIRVEARREGMSWFETNNLSKDSLTEYIDFLKEQL